MIYRFKVFQKVENIMAVRCCEAEGCGAMAGSTGEFDSLPSYNQNNEIMKTMISILLMMTGIMLAASDCESSSLFLAKGIIGVALTFVGAAPYIIKSFKR